MLEKGQLKARIDLAFEEKSLNHVNRFVGYIVRALIIFGGMIASSVLCAAPAVVIGEVTLTWILPLVGAVGLLINTFAAWDLYRNIKKGK